jgi:hypothetical protein
MLIEHIVDMENKNKKTATTILTIALIVSVIYIVSRYYLTPAANVTIIQSKVSEFDIKTLFEKDPIILEEGVVDASQVLNAYFNYLYTFKYRIAPNNKWCHNKARYLIIHNAQYLQIAHPSNKGNPSPNYVDIRLQPNQLVILPSLWLYKVKGGSLTALFDVPSIVLYPFV